MAKKKSDEVVIHDTNVNLSSTALKNAKTSEDVEKLQIFSHLDEDDRQKAHKELVKKLGIGSSPSDSTGGEVHQFGE